VRERSLPTLSFISVYSAYAADKMFVPIIYTACRVAGVCARSRISSVRTRCDVFWGAPLNRFGLRRASLPGRAMLRMDTWTMASAELPEEKMEPTVNSDSTPAGGSEGVSKLDAGVAAESTPFTTAEPMSADAQEGMFSQEMRFGPDSYRRRTRRESSGPRRTPSASRRTASTMRRRPLTYKLTDLQPGQELRGTVCGVVSYGAFVDCGVFYEVDNAEDSSSSFYASSDGLAETSAQGASEPNAMEQEAASADTAGALPNTWGERKKFIPFDGLVHIRDFSREYVENPESFVTRGDEVTVYVKFIDLEKRRLSLSFLPPGQQRSQGRNTSSARNLYTPTETADGRRILVYADSENRRRVGSYQLDETVEGTVRRVTNFGAFVDIGSEVDAFVHVSDLWGQNKQRTLQSIKPGDKFTAQICEINDRAKRIRVRDAEPVSNEHDTEETE
jgi:predicted RNA-binding protein with RPS1 domain